MLTEGTNKGNWLTAMKEVLRSPSPVRSFDVPTSPAPSQGHRQSIDNFLSRLGPGMQLDASFELDERNAQPRRSSGRRSHEMNMNKGTAETKQAPKSSNDNISSKNNSNKNNNHHSSSNGNNMAKNLNKQQIQSGNNTTMNNSNKKLQTQSNKAQTMQGGGVNNNRRSSQNSSIKPVMRHNGVMKTQEEHNSRHARAVAAASAAAAEAAAMAAQAAAEVMRLTAYASTPHGQYSPPPLDDFTLDDLLLASQAQQAATLIQSAYRGHLARQALRALKGLVKLQAVVRGHLVRRQAIISLRCMQALVRLQARVRARQVKAALLLAASGADQKGQEQGLILPSLFLQPHSTHLNGQIQDTPSRHRRLSPFRTDVSSRSSSHISPLLHPLDQSMQSHPHSRALDAFSRTSSLISSEDLRDWDSSALSKEEIEMKQLKRQQALAMRQKALSYAENQRTPKALGTPTRRMSNEYYQGQQQRMNKTSFNETEPEKLHRDWSWLEGWMAAHGATSVWESNAAALWESRDERRDRVGEGEENPIFYESLYEEHGLEDVDYEEDEDNTSHSLLHDHINSDDDPAIKIIEMDRAAPLAPASTLSSPYSSSRNVQHLNNLGPHHHGMISSGRLHQGALVASPQSSTLQPPNLRL